MQVGGTTMDKERKAFTIALLVLLVLWVICLFVPSVSRSEDVFYEQATLMRVTAKQLNGRANPSKKASIEARFDRGDVVEAYDWSENHHWIEVIGGETGSVWVWYAYLNEQEEEYTVWWNDYGGKVKIRKEPFGTVTGYLSKNGEVVIDRIVLGWGHCSKGWIDLRYLTEED
jgi:hypothetical protein